MDANELLERYAAGDRDFRCTDLRDTDLSSADLSSADLSGADLRGVTLRDADLRLTNLKRANLKGANLSGAYLANTNLEEANLFRVNLSNTRLTYAFLKNANLSKANLKNAYLKMAILEEANLTRAYLKDTNLVSASLNFANLCGAKLIGADLSEANLINANLVKTDFTDANLTGAKFDGTLLAYQNVSEELQRKNQELISRLELLEALLEKQNLVDYTPKANLANAKVNGAELCNADLKDANFAETDLTDVRLAGAKLDETILSLNRSFNVSNQGDSAPYLWEGLHFRSKTEIKIAEALESAGVLFYPNSKVRLNTLKGRENRETDFLVFHSGKWGILEVDGEQWHPPSRTVHDHERDRLFKVHGIRVVEHYDACRCWEQPDAVVQEFLQILSQA